MRIQVGLDFGTSTSKVLYALPRAGEDWPRVSRLENVGSPIMATSLVPSLIALPQGELLIGDAARRYLADKPLGLGLSRFKMLVAGTSDANFLDDGAWQRYQDSVAESLGHADAISPDMAAAIYLATLMRETVKHLRTKMPNSEVDAVFNTCVPIDQVENSTVLTSFRHVAAIADHLYREMPRDATPDLSWLDRARDAARFVQYDEGADETRLFVIPEAVASFATYQLSQRSRDGIHAMVDIGAGTTDVSIAYLAKTRRGTGTQWWAAKSVPLAAGHIEDEVGREIATLTLCQPSRQLLGDALAGLDGCEYSDLAAGISRRVLAEIHRRTTLAWAKAYGHYPGQGRWWKEQVQVFLTGGGANLPGARSVFRESWQRKWGPYPCDRLPPPHGVPANEFERLSVAYGLCYSLPELRDFGGNNGDWVLPSNSPVEPINRPTLHIMVDDDPEPGGPT